MIKETFFSVYVQCYLSYFRIIICCCNHVDLLSTDIVLERYSVISIILIVSTFLVWGSRHQRNVGRRSCATAVIKQVTSPCKIAAFVLFSTHWDHFKYTAFNLISTSLSTMPSYDTKDFCVFFKFFQPQTNSEKRKISQNKTRGSVRAQKCFNFCLKLVEW